ncbi:MAG: hypothetical protein M3P24_03045 [Gemmatimonadota bacterium]|nr:hypothetical protein [Gemmatimonadota bacterium]
MRLRNRPDLLLLLVCVAALLPRATSAQASPECPEGRISHVFVDNHAVFDASDPGLDPRFARLYRTVNRLHVPTREGVIRREILFREGDCYSPELLLDSERLLRNTAFIADADIYGVRQADETYHVIVDTEDEWSTRVEPEINSREGGLGGVKLREDNLLGSGQRVTAFVGEDLDVPVYGGSYQTPQLLGSSLDAEVSVEKTPNGTRGEQAVAYPFRGESGRWAFRQRFGHSENYFQYRLPREDRRLRVLFPERRRSLDVGGVFRLGRRGSLTLFGLALAGEWIAYPGEVLLRRGRDSVPQDPRIAGPATAMGLDTVANVRAVFLVGQRNVHFVRRRALDAVRGTEDVRLGVEAELGMGRSLAPFSTDDDLAVDLGLFLARELPGGVVSGGRVVLEGKRDFGAGAEPGEWRNVFGQLAAWSYWRPSPESRHTLVAALDAAGGWRVSVPFQTTLGAWAGLRGYPRHAFTGHRRAVLSLEDRVYWGGPFPQLFDLGSAVFLDVGRSWRGGDPYGEDTPFHASAGVGLRVAFPPGSRRTYVLDAALPVRSGAGLGDMVVSVGIGQAIGRDHRDDRQIRRSSRRALSASLFSFPN